MDHLATWSSSVQLSPIVYSIFLLFLLAYPLIKFLLYLVRRLLKHFSPLPNFKQRYSCHSSVSWAVITDPTDVLGLGFCKVLLKMGFNIVLVSKRSQILQSIVDQLNYNQKEASQKSLLKTIVFDFEQSTQKEKVEAIISQLSSLDVSMLVNNQGCIYTGLHNNLSHQKIVELIHTSCTSMALLTCYLIHQMATRNARSAVINISSLAGTRGIPFSGVLSASNSFINRLSQGLSFEYPSVDIISLKTLPVKSNIPNVNQSAFMTNQEQYALEALKELAWERESFGTLSHDIMGYVYGLLPQFLFKRLIGMCLKKHILSSS